MSLQFLMARNEGVTVSQSVSVVAQRKLRFLCGAAIVICALPLLANRPYLVDDNVALVLQRGTAPGKKLVFDRVPVIDGNPSTLELERFDVWAKGAKIVIHDENGTHEEDPPARYFYKGRVTGQDDSMVFLSVDPKDARDVQGVILIAEKRFFIGRGIRTGGRPSAGLELDAAPLLIRQADPIDDMLDPRASWSCGVEREIVSAQRIKLPAEAMALKPVTDAGGVAGATYTARIAVETDFELYTGLGSTSGAVTTYITSLVGAASTIYQRDVSTTLTLGNLGIYTTVSDPYTVVPGSFPHDVNQGLSELSKVWHSQHCTPTSTCSTTETAPRSAVVMVSGKLFNGGVGWINWLCTPASGDFYCGNSGANCSSADFAFGYAGAYAFCGSAGAVSTTVPDPNATVNGTQYALPNNNNFWILVEFAHELGHVVGESHTQCTALTPAEQLQYSTTRNFVDECYNSDPAANCFTGSTNSVGACFTNGGGYCPAPPELGTIMSYCQNVFCPAGMTCGGNNSGTFRQSRYLFGKTGEPSFKMLGLFTAAIDGETPSGTITIGSAPIPCSAGQTASVPSCSGCTYSWQITGGSITSSTTASSITYTPNATSVTVTPTVTTVSGCAITTQATRLTSCVAIGAPTNVVATAVSSTSVSITWTAVTGATSYTVYRSANNSTYSSVGTPGTNSLTDNSASANTAYLYKVTATGPGGTSGDSNKDFATTVIFTDPTLTVNTTTVKAVHVNELRTAVNAMLALSSHSAATYTDTTITAGTSLIHGVDITELRTNLNNARGFIGFGTITFTDPTITAGTTPIKAVHVNELRAGTQ